MSEVSVVGTQLVAVFVSVCDVARGSEPITLHNGQLLLSYGPRQSKAPLVKTTIGELRESWGDDSIGGDMHPATNAWTHSTDDGNGGVTTVLVNMPLVSGWGDEVDD